MRVLIAIIIGSTVAGLGFGAALAYMDVRRVAPLAELVLEGDGAETSTQPDPSAPQAEVPETTFQFGSIEQGASMSHAFTVRNVGGSPLALEVGETTCKCTVGEISENELQPGESTEVNLEWYAATGSGPFRHSATLLTSDPQQSRIELTVEGNVISSTTQLSPREIVIRNAQAGDTKEIEVLLMSFVEQDLEILGHEIKGEGLSEQIDLRFEPVGKDQLPSPDAVNGIKIVATYQAGRTIGPIRGEIILNTNLEKAEKLFVPIEGRVIGDITVYGPGWREKNGLLHLGRISGVKGKKVKFSLAVRGEEAGTTEFELDSVDPPELKVTVGERRKISEKLVHVQLFVEVPPGTKQMVRLGEPASTDAMIVLRTTHSQSPELRLRTHFTVGP